MHVQLRMGELLFSEGDPPTTAFLIEKGQIEIRANQGGTDVVLSVLGPGDLVGEMAVIDDSVRTASAMALSDCTLLIIGRDQIAERLSGTDPIIRSLLEGQLKRYRGALAVMQGKQKAPTAQVGNRGDELSVDKIRLESQLRDALSSNGLDLCLQPLLNVSSNQIAGYEALIRWNHPERGAVSPLEFVTLAEETSLIVPVGEYVFDAACEAVRLLNKAGHQPAPFVAVNVSGRQLRHGGLIGRILGRVDRAGLPPGSVKIEITESQMLDYGLVAGVIDVCHAHGIKVALDDFGTGYSHLAHLHNLKFDTIKIDQAFTRAMVETPRSLAIVRAIVDLARAIDAETVVEGIETEQQLDILREFGCTYAQGYLVGKPQLVKHYLG